MVSHNPPTIMVSIQSDPKSPEGLKGGSTGIRAESQGSRIGFRDRASSCLFMLDDWREGQIAVSRMMEERGQGREGRTSTSTRTVAGGGGGDGGRRSPSGSTGRPTVPLTGPPADLLDTSRNVLSTRQFCCSIISETFVEAANYTSIDAPPDISEWDLSGLTPRQSE
jgi:hypothetical protein